MSAGTNKPEWLAVGVGSNPDVRRMPHSFPAEMQRLVETLTASTEWTSWWAATELPRLDVDLNLGSYKDFGPGDMQFRRRPDRIHVQMFSLATQQDVTTLDAKVLVRRDLAHLFGACTTRFDIMTQRPPEELAPDRDAPPPSAERAWEGDEEDATVLELHIPLVADAAADADAYQFQWLIDVEQHLHGLEDQDEIELFDDGEEVGDEYLFFLTGRPDAELIEAASRIASRPGVPAGAYIVLNTGHDDFGIGTRIDLP